MKQQLYKTFLLAGVLILSIACDDFLDKEPTDVKTEKDIYSSFQQTEQQIERLYYWLRAADRPLAQMAHYSESPCCDEAECTSTSEANNLTNRFNEGDWEPGSNFWSKTTSTSSGNSTQSWWPELYKHIRTANKILECIETYNTPDSPSEPGTLMNRVGELYFIRAYLHYVILRSYGECPYIDRSFKQDEIPETFTRENVHSIIEKICNDCDEAFDRVPDQNLSRKFGRVDRGACLGLKAMARWIAATPLYNGSTLKNDTRSFAADYKIYKEERWAAAKEACEAVMNFTINGAPRYSLYIGSPQNVYGDRLGANTNNSMVPSRLWELYISENSTPMKSEWIWFVLRDKSAGWWGDNYPPSSSGGGREMPTQDQVDEYEVIGPDGYGYPIYALKENHRALYNGLISETDMAKAYDDENPYVNRDPRFYRDVSYHGATFKNIVLNMASGADKINAANSTTTGYFLRKFIDGSHNKAAGSGAGFLSCPPLIRLATIHLIWAEAVTRTTGPDQEVYNLDNAIRSRSFMAPMPPATITNRELMLDYIARERRVELYHEKCRFWQCRLYLEPTSQLEQTHDEQWNSLPGSTNDEKAQQYFAKYGAYPKTQRRVCGMRPVEDANGKITVGGKKYKMQRFWVEDRVFNEKHYLFPIPIDELQKAGIAQNPNW